MKRGAFEAFGGCAAEALTFATLRAAMLAASPRLTRARALLDAGARCPRGRGEGGYPKGKKKVEKPDNCPKTTLHVEGCVRHTMGQDVSYQPYPHSVLDGVVVAATRTMPFSAPHNTPRAAGTHATVVAPSSE